MSSVPIYQIDCPHGHAIEMPETILDGIIQHLRGSYRGEPVLNFVCSECKTAFHFDYPNRVRVGQTDAPRHLSEFRVLSVQTGCDDNYCVDHVVLIAVRNRDMSEESIRQETKTWNVSGARCKSGFPALPIGF
jgi:hypothetical protein